MTDPARFWNRIAARYARQPVADPASYARKLEQTRARLRPGWDLLEVGCGTGATALAHAPHVARVRAVDISGKMLEVARARAAGAGAANLRFERAGLDDLGPDAASDAVLMLSLLHLLPDWRGGIDRAWALTRPGGIFVSSTACLATLPAPARLALRLLGRLGLVPRLSLFSPAALEEAIRGRGFEIEECWQPAPRAALFVIARRPAAG